VDVQLHVRNFRSRPQRHRIALHTPPGVHADPPVQEGTLGPRERRASPLRLRADATAPLGVAIVGLDVTLAALRRAVRLRGRRHGAERTARLKLR
jgi:hypothetical protein